MIRGLYTSTAGMLVQMAKNEVTANNLANVNTTGFKKDTAVFRSFPEMLLSRINDPQPFVARPVIGALGTGAVLDEVITSHLGGSLQETGSPLHLAIAGEGFFVVDRGGREVYTRNGNFTLNQDGYLVTATGDQVLGSRGAIQLREKKVSVDEQGGIWADQQLVDRLRLTSVANTKDLDKLGDSLYAGGQAIPFNGTVRQGFLENSNVNPVVEMVELITVMRAYETNQKAIQAHDQTLEKAVNDVGRT